MHTCYHPELHVGVSPLSEEEALHVVRVLRMTRANRSAHRWRRWRGRGNLDCRGKRKASVHVEKVDREESRPRGLVLVVAPTKATDRFEWLLEKATELGVEAVIPVWTERSERRVDKHERWRKVVVAATKQCQRRWMPELHEACSLKDLFDQHPALKTRPGAVAHCMSSLLDGLTACLKRWQEGQSRAVGHWTRR